MTEKNLVKISLNFSESFITEKYVKIRFNNMGSTTCYFIGSRGQKIKNTTKVERTRLFLFITFLFSFFMAFLAQKLIYIINIRFDFVFSLFFEQDHLLNLKTETDTAQDLIHYFFVTLTAKELFHRKDFKEKKMYGFTFYIWGCFLKKRKLCM